MQLPKVSIIIPCYNQGHYLNEALSNLEPRNNDYEVIIINDGSTDKITISELELCTHKGFQVINQVNKGLAEARNIGIEKSTGDFIMLLDADNCVQLDFIYNALNVFESDTNVAVVYSDALYFGQKKGRWVVGEFNLQKLMIDNYIDACAMVRKNVFTQLGGYDSKMKEIKSGWEDWEMWLRISFSGKKFVYLPEIGFKYRVHKESMIGEIKNNYQVRNMLNEYIHNKYPAQIGHQHISNFVLKRFKPHPVHFLVKLVLMAWFTKHYNQLLSKNKIIRGI